MGDGTEIGKVRGLGSGHGGSGHWLHQRYTALGNLFLGAWFIASLLLLGGFDMESVHDWLVAPIPATAMILLIVSTFYHARLGLQVMIEDYVHDEGLKIVALMLNTFFVVAIALVGIFSVLKLSFGA